MPERKELKEEEAHDSTEGGTSRRRRRERDSEKESGDNPLKHARILERRWLGSPAPTAERYALAFQQWQALSGAVVAPASGTTATPAEKSQR